MSALDRAVALRAALRAVPGIVRVRCSWRTFTDLHTVLDEANIELDFKKITGTLDFKKDDGSFIPFEAHLELEDGLLTVDTLSGTTVTLAWPYVDTRYQAEGLPLANSLKTPTVVTQPDMEYLRFMVNQAEADEARDFDPDDD